MPSKLRGMEFFRSIGSPQRIVAPMVDQSELAFRMLCRNYGAQLCYTPMLHSRLFAESSDYRAKMFEPHKDDRPLIVQFCGNDPNTILAAARHVEGHCDAVDINLGCPQGIARKGNYGAFLMKNKLLVRDIVQTLSRELSIPVTCKIRIFPDAKETIEFSEMLEKAGCGLLVVHGRTKEMNKLLTGKVDWEIIREIKTRLSIPVIANGGIELAEDVEKCLEITGADGVMSSEAILENPALFASHPDNNPCNAHSQLSYLNLAMEYMEFVRRYPPPKLKIIRAHLFKILYQDLSRHVDLRDILASTDSEHTMRDIIDTIVARENGRKDYTQEMSWYRRHRKSSKRAIQKAVKTESCEELPDAYSLVNSLHLLYEAKSN